eukprot:746584-Hanusia_phi.AAC.5
MPMSKQQWQVEGEYATTKSHANRRRTTNVQIQQAKEQTKQRTQQRTQHISIGNEKEGDGKLHGAFM